MHKQGHLWEMIPIGINKGGKNTHKQSENLDKYCWFLRIKKQNQKYILSSKLSQKSINTDNSKTNYSRNFKFNILNLYHA